MAIDGVQTITNRLATMKHPWAGQSLAGKKLLIWGEFIAGDELMFVTADEIAGDMASDIHGRNRIPLLPLFQRSFPQFKIYARQNPTGLLCCDRNLITRLPPVIRGSFCALIRTDFAASQPYLKADADHRLRFRKAYVAQANGRPIVGISWRSGSEHAGVPRSIPLSDLQTLVADNSVNMFVNLQYGQTDMDLKTMRNMGCAIIDDVRVDPLKDMDLAAAQIAAMDLVVSGGQHYGAFGGALGISTWGRPVEDPDWRWLAEGTASPWYPNVRLFLANWTSGIGENRWLKSFPHYVGGKAPCCYEKAASRVQPIHSHIDRFMVNRSDDTYPRAIGMPDFRSISRCHLTHRTGQDCSQQRVQSRSNQNAFGPRTVVCCSDHAGNPLD